MNCPPTNNELGLIGYWNFEEGSGETVLDLSQNDNNGNSNGDALASVLGFLNQMANEGAKPKVPKVPLKDVFGVPNFIQHVVHELDSTDRGDGGFGSTGK